MPPPSRAHTTAAASQQARQNRNARARHSLDNTGFSIDSSELPSGLIVDYSIDEVVRPGNIADLRRGQQAESIHLDDEDEDDGDGDIDPEDVDPGKADSFSSFGYAFVLFSCCLLALLKWIIRTRSFPDVMHEYDHPRSPRFYIYGFYLHRTPAWL